MRTLSALLFSALLGYGKAKGGGAGLFPAHRHPTAAAQMNPPEQPRVLAGPVVLVPNKSVENMRQTLSK